MFIFLDLTYGNMWSAIIIAMFIILFYVIGAIFAFKLAKKTKKRYYHRLGKVDKPYEILCITF